MRHYASVSDYGSTVSIIFRDDGDPPNRWTVFEKNITSTNADLMVEALNQKEKETLSE